MWARRGQETSGQGGGINSGPAVLVLRLGSKLGHPVACDVAASGWQMGPGSAEWPHVAPFTHQSYSSALRHMPAGTATAVPRLGTWVLGRRYPLGPIVRYRQSVRRNAPPVQVSTQVGSEVTVKLGYMTRIKAVTELPQDVSIPSSIHLSKIQGSSLVPVATLNASSLLPAELVHLSLCSLIQTTRSYIPRTPNK